MRHLRSTGALILLAAGVVACSSPATPSSSPSIAAASVPSLPPTPEPTINLSTRIDELIDAAVATLAERTVRVEQTLEFSGSSVIPDGTSGRATGQATLGEPIQLRLDADFSELGAGKLVMIRDESRVYMRGSAFEQLTGPGRWLLVDLDSDAPAAAPFKSIASGQNDVSMAIYYLYGTTKIVGIGPGEELSNRPTTRYNIEIDLEAARDHIPEDRSEALEDLIAGLRTSGIERTMNADAWVGENGLVYRLHFLYRLGPTQGNGTMETFIDFGRFGAPMQLGVPPRDQVVKVEDAL